MGNDSWVTLRSDISSVPLPRVTLQRAGAGDGARAEPAGSEDEGADRARRRLVCRWCGTRITTDAERIAVDGSHEHTFMNPHGIVFRIGCFGDAAGCLVTGSPTSEYTWFPGFAWNCAACGGCGNFLGWRFESGGRGFFGLILDELAAE